MANNYSAEQIEVLKGLEAVRKRPGMYIGGVGPSGLHHLIWEILDNAVDEAMNGHASEIEVTLHSDGRSVTVDDDGRGIPVDLHPKYKKYIRSRVRLMVHDEKGEAREGDLVRIAQTRPLSVTKRWRLVEVITRARR